MSQQPVRPRRRQLINLLVWGVVALVVAACGVLQQSKQERAVSDAISAEIQQDLERRPDVVEAKVVYQDNLNASATVSAFIFVTPDANVDAVIDEALRLLWASKLNPLQSITVDITDRQNRNRSTEKRLFVGNPEDKAELERKYGPHPSK